MKVEIYHAIFNGNKMHKNSIRFYESNCIKDFTQHAKKVFDSPNMEWEYLKDKLGFSVRPISLHIESTDDRPIELY